MSDLGARALACCVVAGALLARPVPVAAGVLGLVVAFVVRRPTLLCVAAAVLASGR